MAARKAAASNGHRLVSLDELLHMPLPTEEVVIPEYDVKVELHALNGLQRAELAAKAPEDDASAADRLAFVHELVAASMGASADDVARLPAAVIDRIGASALRMAGIGAQAVVEAEKILKVTPSGDSG
jgi:hypothetical protein